MNVYCRKLSKRNLKSNQSNSEIMITNREIKKHNITCKNLLDYGTDENIYKFKKLQRKN